MWSWLYDEVLQRFQGLPRTLAHAVGTAPQEGSTAALVGLLTFCYCSQGFSGVEGLVTGEDMQDTGAVIFVHGTDIGLTNSLILVLKMWHKIKSDGDAHGTGKLCLWKSGLGNPALQGLGPIALLG